MHNYGLVLFFLFHLYIIATIIFLILDNRDPATTFAWVFVFIVFPIGGIILYFLIGRNWRMKKKSRRIAHKQLTKDTLEGLGLITKNQEEYLKELMQRCQVAYKNKLFTLLHKSSNSVLTVKNDIKVYFQGEQKFEDLKRDLLKANKFIHMQYFIWRDDVLTREIKQILVQKSKEGVAIRILYDAVGGFGLSLRYIQKLRNAGIEIFPYYDFWSPFTIHTLNYRNHRKIVVIDGGIGYTGGMNMGQEYIDGGRHFDFWSDTHIRLEGESVNVLQAVFATTWANTTKKNLLDVDYFPVKDFESEKVLPIQITISGPDSEWESIQQLYFTLITSAEKKIYIRSPYFIPDESIYTALETAALSGCDVRIMMTGNPDKKLPFWAAYTYFKKLLKAGVKIYHYKRGFLHSKSVVVDDYICSIGSANMDVRSFHLNYEINTLIYDAGVSGQVSQSFEDDLGYCHEITLDEYSQINSLIKFRNSIARLFTPLL